MHSLLKNDVVRTEAFDLSYATQADSCCSEQVGVVSNEVFGQDMWRAATWFCAEAPDFFWRAVLHSRNDVVTTNLHRVLLSQSLGPISAVQRSVVNSFGNVRGGDGVGIVEISNRPADFQDSVVGSGRQPEPGHCAFQHSLTFRIDPAILSYQPG